LHKTADNERLKRTRWRGAA